MEDDQINDLAALLGPGLSDSEREQAANELLTVPEARRLLFVASFPGFKENLKPQAPFEIAGTLTLGIYGTYLRVLESEGVTLTRGSARLVTALKSVSWGKLPACLKGRMECEASLGQDQTPFHLQLKAEDEGFRFSLAPLGACAGRVEIWKDGELIRNLPVENLEKRPIAGTKPGSTLSVRIEGSPTGASVVLVPIEFGRTDFMAAGIVNILCGNLAEGFELFSKVESASEQGGGVGEKILSWIRGIGAVTRFEEGNLFPAPALRAVGADPEERLSLFLPVWSGILSCWPEAAGLPNPWTVSQSDLGAETRLAPDVAILAQSTLDAARGGTSEPIVPPISESTADPLVSAGWTALEGWVLLSERNYEGALEKFGSLPQEEGKDPFGLGLGSTLAAHLMRSDSLCRSEMEESSDRVWREVFEGMIKE